MLEVGLPVKDVPASVLEIGSPTEDVVDMALELGSLVEDLTEITVRNIMFKDDNIKYLWPILCFP